MVSHGTRQVMLYGNNELKQSCLTNKMTEDYNNQVRRLYLPYIFGPL